jgi:hypothetical protein
VVDDYAGAVEQAANASFIWRSFSVHLRAEQPPGCAPRYVTSCTAQEDGMSHVRYFVIPHDDHWLVTLEGRAMARHNSQPQAINSAIVMADLMGAMHHEADVMVEDERGAPLRLVWVYGKDKAPVAPVPILQVVPSHSHVKHVQSAPEMSAS